MIKKIKLLLPAIVSFAIVGCGSDSVSILTSSTSVIDSTDTQDTGDNTEGTVEAMFAGATFVQVNDAESLLTNEATTSIVTFTYDTVTWFQSDGQETGSYVRGDSYPWVASFASDDMEFQPDGGDLLWGTETYNRADGAAFDSQQSMMSYLDGATYKTAEQFDGGETATGDIAQANWSVRFDEDNIYWTVRDTVSAGSISYIDDSTFSANFTNRTLTIVALSESELVINSILYRKEPTVHFTSQDTMLAYLDNASYESVDLRPGGETVDGTVALTNWRIDFTDGTFNWFYQDIAEAGTMAFSDNNTATLLFANREYAAIFSENYLTFNEVRYQRVSE